MDSRARIEARDRFLRADAAMDRSLERGQDGTPEERAEWTAALQALEEANRVLLPPHPEGRERERSLFEQDVETARRWLDDPGEPMSHARCQKVSALIRLMATEITRLREADPAAQLQKERDDAVREAARRDRKWMEGLNQIAGMELEYDPLGREPGKPWKPTLEEYVDDLKRQAAPAAQTEPCSVREGVWTHRGTCGACPAAQTEPREPLRFECAWCTYQWTAPLARFTAKDYESCPNCHGSFSFGGISTVPAAQTGAPSPVERERLEQQVEELWYEVRFGSMSAPEATRRILAALRTAPVATAPVDLSRIGENTRQRGCPECGGAYGPRGGVYECSRCGCWFRVGNDGAEIDRPGRALAGSAPQPEGGE